MFLQKSIAEFGVSFCEIQCPFIVIRIEHGIVRLYIHLFSQTNPKPFSFEQNPLLKSNIYATHLETNQIIR